MKTAEEFANIAKEYSGSRPEIFLDGKEYKTDTKTSLKATVTDRGDFRIYDGTKQITVSAFEIQRFTRWLKETFDTGSKPDGPDGPDGPEIRSL